MQLLQKLGFLIFRALNVATIRRQGVTVACARDVLPLRVRKSLYKHEYEADEAQLVNDYIEQGDLVVEIGAATGFVSLLIAKKTGVENVHIFEPNPYMHPLIERNFELNDLSPNLNKKAVTPEGGAVAFYVDAKIVGSSLFDRGNKGEKITVDAIRFDDVLEQFEPSALVIDVEGAESALLGGDLKGVTKIIVEVHPHIVGADEITGLIENLKAKGFDKVAERGDVLAFVR